jgi:Xaa-Pro dipeptidase
MSVAGLDAVVTASPVNVRYLTGYACRAEGLFEEWMLRPGGTTAPAQEAFAILRPVGDATLLVAAGVAPDALRCATDDIRVFGRPPYDEPVVRRHLPGELLPVLTAQEHVMGDDAPTGLIALLRHLGLADAVLGIDRDGMAPHTVANLAEALPKATFRNCSNLLRLTRMVKDAFELELLERSAAINEQSAHEVLAAALPGDSIHKLRSEFVRYVCAAGADFGHFATGEWGLGGSTSSGYVLADGDVLCVDFGCRAAGYFADAGVTVALGALRPELYRRYEALRAAILEVGIDAMAPGVAASAVHHAMASYLAGEGLTGAFPTGHGIGLEVRDYPIVVPDTGLRIADDTVDVPADVLLEEGMVVNLEVTQFIPGVGSLEVEVTTLVTGAGARPFVTQERSEPLAPDFTLTRQRQRRSNLTRDSA